jgi:hypothetical protein
MSQCCPRGEGRAHNGIASNFEYLCISGLLQVICISGDQEMAFDEKILTKICNTTSFLRNQF